MKKIIIPFLVGILVLYAFSVDTQASVRKSVFNDLSMNNTFYESIYSMYAKGVLDSKITIDGKNLINSSGIVTRADAAYMLFKLQGMTPESGKGFPDVSPNDYYYEAVKTLGAKGIVSGYDDGSFRPEAQLTRSQMARIIAGAFDYPINLHAKVPFTDVNERWAPYVDALYRNGVTAGVTATSFTPNKQLTRGEISAFMDRAYKKVPGSSYNDFEVINATNEAIHKTRQVMVQGLEKYFPNQKASDISADMAQLAIDPYLKTALSGYETSCYNCDGANVLANFEFALPYEILLKSNTLLRVDATVPSNSINSGYRGTIELVRSGESWKIKSYKTRSFTEDPLALTIDEAEDYLSYAISKYWQEEVSTIKHTGKEPRFGLDLFLINGKSTYIFNVNTGEVDHYLPN